MEKESETFCESNRMESVDMVPCSEIKRVCEADIIVTTTPSRVPVVQAQWVRKGTHINAIGADAPGKQELATDLLLSARVVVDEWSPAAHAGEINSAVSQNQMSREKIVGQLGEIIAGRLTGRQADSDVTVFDSTGLAIQDVSVSRFLFEKAVKINKGQVLKLHG
jgi:alanine dehydrogenase